MKRPPAAASYVRPYRDTPRPPRGRPRRKTETLIPLLPARKPVCTFVQSTAGSIARECEDLHDFFRDPGQFEVETRRVGVARPSAGTTYKEIIYPNGPLPDETSLLVFNAKDFPHGAVEKIWRNVRRSIEAQFVIFLSFLPGDHGVLDIFNEPYQFVRSGVLPEDLDTSPLAPSAYVVTAEHKRLALGAILKNIKRRAAAAAQIPSAENITLPPVTTPKQ